MKTAIRINQGKNGRQTFRKILDASRMETAQAAWGRARLASYLMHWASWHGNKKAAMMLANIKAAALRRVAAILPQEVHVGIDSEYQIGLVSVAWRGHGRLHLPADASMTSVA